MKYPPQKRNVTLRDVARHAGVSASTASAALNNGDARYNEQTVQRIRDIARTLGYRPNRSAQSVRTQRNRLIGMIHFAGPMQVANERAHYIGRAVDERQYELLTVDIHWHDGRLSKVVDRLLEARVAGIIVTGVGIDDPAIDAFYQQGVPIVGVSSNYSPRFPLFRADMYQGIKEITQHLLAQGCRRLLALNTANFEVSGQLSWQQNRQVEGIRDAVVEAGGEYDCGTSDACRDWISRSANAPGIMAFTRFEPHDIIYFDPFLFARRSVSSFKDLPDLPDAIICPNDDWAVGAISELHTVGVRVPEDILITGYNNSALAANFPTPITTVRQPTGEIARKAVNLLIEAIESGQPFPQTEQIHELPCTTIFRASSEVSQTRSSMIPR